MSESKDYLPCAGWEYVRQDLWDEGADMQFLYFRTGRPGHDNYDLPKECLRQCLDIHLWGCLHPNVYKFPDGFPA